LPSHGLFAFGANALGALATGKHACRTAVNAYEDAQQSEEQGHLLEARDSLQQCMADSQSTCAVLARKCWVMQDQLELAMPSIVPAVNDDAGDPVLDVQVTMDGALLTPRLDGRALPVDPGMHKFSFSTGGHVFAGQTVLIAEGQHYRPLTVVKRAARMEPARQASSVPVEASSGPIEKRARGPSAWPYVIGITGLAAVGGGALLTYWGRKDNDLLSRCAPDCDPANLTHIRTLYTAADIALATGAGALVLSTLLFASHHSTEEHPRYTVGLRPTPSGGYATLTRVF
jgi:hypothetical protein